MPKVTLADVRQCLWYEYRFVPANYLCETYQWAEVTDPGVIANITIQLDLHAGYCWIQHDQDCPCPARRTNRNDERPMLVLHETDGKPYSRIALATKKDT